MKENEKLKQDKESTEGTALNAQDQLAQALKDNLLLKQQISALQEESRALKQKSKEEVADLEYKLEQLLAKKQSLVVETGTLHSAVAELESACRRHLEDKREMRTAAAEQQLRLSEAMLRKEEQEKLVNEERIKWTAQREEWQQFQKVHIDSKLPFRSILRCRNVEYLSNRVAFVHPMFLFCPNYACKKGTLIE